MKVDVWALGVIIYVLLCGYPPFVSPTGEQEDLFDLILSGEYDFPEEQWQEISEDAKDLITRMIESDVDIRLCADEVRKVTPFFYIALRIRMNVVTLVYKIIMKTNHFPGSGSPMVSSQRGGW